jgi:putative redox protein
MRTTQISARWTGEGLNYVGTDTKGNQVVMGGSHVSPGQMVLLGLAGCMGMDVLSILQKKRQKVADVQVLVTGQQPDDYPRPYQLVEVLIIVKGEDINPNAVARAIELSEEKYCTVGQTLQNKVELKATFAIEELLESKV